MTTTNQINSDMISRIFARAKACGSSATTLTGACKYILAHPQDHIFKAAPKSADDARDNAKRRIALDAAKPGDTVQIPEGSYRAVAMADETLRQAAFAAAIKRHPRKKNLYKGEAKKRGPAQWDREETIVYKGKFKGWKGSEIYADYQSALAITRSGRSAVLVQAAKLVRRIIAPAGMQWQKDDAGILLRRSSDGMDYHPTLDDLRSKKFTTLVREAMAKNHALRIELRKRDREQARQQAIIDREIGNTPVALEDARRAGYCVQGTIEFCSRRLGLTKDEIIAGGHLFAIPARRVLALGDDRAKKTAQCAWERETLVSI